MVRITTTDFFIPDRCAVTIGKFDGMHKGHQMLLLAIKKEAERQGLKTIVFTFSASPRAYLMNEEIGCLMTPEEREEMLSDMGIDYLIEYPFSDEVRTMAALTFLEKVLIEKIHMAYLAVGEDFGFGYKRQGDCAFLKKNQKKYSFYLDIFPKIKYNEKDISSSYIRECIRKGAMEDAANMLGRQYGFCGTVEHGKSIGHTIGFPTINIVPEQSKVLPPRGVYFSIVEIKGKRYWGVANIGVQPTVGIHRLLLEIYVLNFNEMIYGVKVRTWLYRFHRPERCFAGVDALKRQLGEDTGACIRFFQETGD